jgi:hypothetical protein
MDKTILTQLGPSTLTDRTPDGKLLVRFSKSDYPPEQWRQISPHNGPCVYRIIEKSEIKEPA